jgi:hypothetical protein
MSTLMKAIGIAGKEGATAWGVVVAPIVLGYPVAWPQSPGRSAPKIHWID